MDQPTTPEWGREVRRANHKIELRRADEDAKSVLFRGYAAVWDVEYEPYGPVEDGGFREVFQRGAFKRSLGRPRNRALLAAHDNGRVVTTTDSGGLRLVEDSIGLLVEAELDVRQTWIHDLSLQIESGVISEMSHAFRATRGGDRWNKDYTERAISEAELFEVSVLWAGANPATHAMVERNLADLAEIRSKASEAVSFDRVRIAAQAALASRGK